MTPFFRVCGKFGGLYDICVGWVALRWRARNFISAMRLPCFQISIYISSDFNSKKIRNRHVSFFDRLDPNFTKNIFYPKQQQQIVFFWLLFEYLGNIFRFAYKAQKSFEISGKNKLCQRNFVYATLRSVIFTLRERQKNSISTEFSRFWNALFSENTSFKTSV